MLLYYCYNDSSVIYRATLSNSMARLRKMYRIKLVLVSLCLATFLYAARNRIFPRLPSGSIRLSSSSSSGGALSAQEFLRDVARIHTCPVCFGTDLCQELTR